MDARETIIPNTINDIDFLSSSFLEIFLTKGEFLSLLIRFEKGLFTLKNKLRKALFH